MIITKGRLRRIQSFLSQRSHLWLSF